MNWIQIVGLILIVLALVCGAVFEYPQEMFITIGAAAIGFILVVKGQIEKYDKEKDWLFYVILGFYIVGVMIATYGGLTESTLNMIIGAIFLVVGVFASLIKAKYKKLE